MNVATGNSYYYGNTTCIAGSCASDARLKKNIQPLGGSLDKLLALRGVTYEWKSTEGHPAGAQTGFIAQEVEKVFPGWIDEHADGMKGITLPPMQLAAMTVEAFRELKTENDALKAHAKEQDERIARLEKLAGLDRVSWFERNQTLLLGLGLIGGFAGLSRLRRKREDDKRP